MCLLCRELNFLLLAPLHALAEFVLLLIELLLDLHATDGWKRFRTAARTSRRVTLSCHGVAAGQSTAARTTGACVAIMGAITSAISFFFWSRRVDCDDAGSSSPSDGSVGGAVTNPDPESAAPPALMAAAGCAAAQLHFPPRGARRIGRHVAAAPAPRATASARPPSRVCWARGDGDGVVPRDTGGDPIVPGRIGRHHRPLRARHHLAIPVPSTTSTARERGSRAARPCDRRTQRARNGAGCTSTSSL